MMGSGLEEKYMAAMMTCMGDGKVVTGRQGKGKGKNSGKGKSSGKTSGKGKNSGKGKSSGKTSGNGKGKGKGGNNGGKCPAFDEIMKMIEEEYETEYCVLQAVGWVDNEGNVDQAVIDSDISSLPAGVQSGLDEDKMKMCVQDMMADMADDLGDCFDEFSEEQQGMLVEMAEHISSYECFMKSFKYACQDYIKTDVMDLVTSMLSGNKL